VILRFNYEEIQALRAGARAFLERDRGAAASAVLAPPESRARVEALLPRLAGDLSFSTLAELRHVQIGVAAIVECLRVEMDSAVLATHPADEAAVTAYFDYAHGLFVAGRVQELAAEMEAMIELVTGEPASMDSARTFRFPD
jgi:hypothetical protein